MTPENQTAEKTITDDALFHKTLYELSNFLSEKIESTGYGSKEKISMHLNLCVALSALSLSKLTVSAINSLPLFMKGVKNLLNEYEKSTENQEVTVSLGEQPVSN